MAKYLKCAVCGETFNIETIQGVKYNAKRYAHYNCFPQGEIVPLKEDAISRKILYDFIRDYFRFPAESGKWAVITRALNRMIADNQYTYSGMYKTIFWYLNVKGETINSIEEMFNTLYTHYEEASQYFYFLYLVNQENEKHMEYATPKQVVLEIKRPTADNTKIKLFNLDD